MWIEELAKNYFNTISFLNVVAIYLTLWLSIFRDRGKFLIYAIGKVVAPKNQAEQPMTVLSAMMVNSRKESVYIGYEAFQWRLSWPFKYFFEVIINHPSDPSREKFPIEIKPYQNYTVFFSDIKSYSQPFKTMTFRHSNGLSWPFKLLGKFLDGKPSPLWMIHFLSLYVVTGSVEVFKARWHTGLRKAFTKLIKGNDTK